MRGTADRQETMLTLMLPGKRVPGDHPIRRIKAIADAELERLSPVFDRMYSERGRYSIPPERLLESCLLIALYSVRSERQFCEQLDYNLLFRFFLDMGNDEDAFDASSFAKNRDRLVEHEVARLFFEGVVRQAKAAQTVTEMMADGLPGVMERTHAASAPCRPLGKKLRRKYAKLHMLTV